MSFMLLSILMECIIPRLNPNVNYGLWMIICQCSFISCDKCITLLRNVDDEESYACFRVGSVWYISVCSLQICCELKIAHKFFFKSTVLSWLTQLLITRKLFNWSQCSTKKFLFFKKTMFLKLCFGFDLKISQIFEIIQ